LCHPSDLIPRLSAYRLEGLLRLLVRSHDIGHSLFRMGHQARCPEIRVYSFMARLRVGLSSQEEKGEIEDNGTVIRNQGYFLRSLCHVLFCSWTWSILPVSSSAVLAISQLDNYDRIARPNHTLSSPMLSSSYPISPTHQFGTVGTQVDEARIQVPIQYA